MVGYNFNILWHIFIFRCKMLIEALWGVRHDKSELEVDEWRHLGG